MDQSNLESRLARSERTARIAILAAACSLLVGFAAGCGSNSYKTLKAERIEIVNGQGNTVGVIFGDENGGAISLDDPEGKPRLALAADQANPRLEIFDAEGKTRVALNAEANGAALALCDENGMPRANLFYYDDQSWVGFFGADGGLTMRIPEE